MSTLKKHKKTRLVIVGEDALTFIYKQLASSNKKIIFPGRVSSNTLLEYYKAADLFVLPSVWHEPQATVLYEAMAAKLPIVATSTGGTTELINECKSGILVEPRSVSELVNGIEKLLSNDKLMKEFGENGYVHISNNYTWDKIAESVVEIYNSVLKK